MSDRSWFYAAQGQQQGPFAEAQFRNLVARNTVMADTLVWTEGMSGWQRAGDIPGLMPGRSGPPAMPSSRAPQASAAGQYGGGQSGAADQYAVDRYGPGGGPLSFEPGLWEFLGQSLLYVIGMLLVVPAPWLATGYYRWVVSRVHVPDRPNLAFTGQPMDIWYALVGIGVLEYAGLWGGIIQLISVVGQIYLSWMVLRWVVSHLSSNGQPLPITFDGSFLIYIGWHLLLGLSVITIIGWPWVAVAQARWICRNISGTHREIIFKATGLEMLWRTFVFVFACGLIIPIPWMLRWYVRWLVSQFELLERAA